MSRRTTHHAPGTSLASPPAAEAPPDAPGARRGTWQLARGATPGRDGVRFSVWAPAARSVAVRLLDADGAVRAEHPLRAGARGEFAAEVPGVGAGTDYVYVLDGERALPDPVSRWQPHGVHGPSRVVDPAAFRWSDDGWTGLPSLADYVIYELHVGTFTPEGTFDAVIPHLRGLRELGVTAIELMPVAEFPGGRNWGYDGVHLYAPQSTYGGPEGLRRLVDAAHREGLAVVLDVVYNHLGPEGNYLDAFGPYFTDRYRTPWGRAVNYDGPGSDPVRHHVIDNARYWVTEFHVDALRLDAVHGIFDLGARHVLAELTDAVHAQARALGRHVHLIAESDLNDPRVVRPTAEHGLGFDAQWADDLHHALHAALTGERSGYYEDFGGAAPVIAALRDPFVYAGTYSPHRDRTHGEPPTGLPRERFVVCAQNHDQVGNRARGERLAALVPPERQRLAAALVLLSGYVPLLFMGEEYGETAPFQYFVSHGDPGLLDAVREGRRAEFASFGWGAEVPDPGDEATFRRSTLDRSKLAEPRHAAILALYRDLLALRRAEPGLRPDAAPPRVDGDASAAWVTATFEWGGRAVWVAFNLSADAVAVPLPPLPVAGGTWTPLLSTDDPRYGGAGRGGRPAAAGADGEGPATIRVPPHAAEVYAASLAGVDDGA